MLKLWISPASRAKVIKSRVHDAACDVTNGFVSPVEGRTEQETEQRLMGLVWEANTLSKIVTRVRTNRCG
jgi:hypothetical protein